MTMVLLAPWYHGQLLGCVPVHRAQRSLSDQCHRLSPALIFHLGPRCSWPFHFSNEYPCLQILALYVAHWFHWRQYLYITPTIHRCFRHICRPSHSGSNWSVSLLVLESRPRSISIIRHRRFALPFSAALLHRPAETSRGLCFSQAASFRLTRQSLDRASPPCSLWLLANVHRNQWWFYSRGCGFLSAPACWSGFVLMN